MESKDKNEITLYFRVLGYQTDTKSWAAHCLETDLVGYGNSFKAALNNLLELTEMQFTFAQYKNQPSLLDKPAPAEIFEMYNHLLRSKLEGYFWHEKVDSKREITSIPWPMNLSDTDFAIAQM